jgi:hypothetical protein
MLLCVITEKGKQKPKRKRAKKDSTLEPAVKKTKVQAADNEERKRTSEAVNKMKIHKMNSNKVQENNASKGPVQTIFSSSLYTQELSNKETENSKEEPFNDSKIKPLPLESNTGEILKGSAKEVEAVSSATKSDSMSIPKCKQPSTSNKRKKITDETSTVSGDESETQFSAASKQHEDIMNCSQDLFSSQYVTAEQNTSQKKNADTNDGMMTLIGSCTSDGLNSRNVYAPHGQNKANEIMIDSCMATERETSEAEQIQTTNSVMRMLEENTGNMMESGGTVNDNESSMRGIVSSAQSVMQPDISNQSTISATHSRPNCSDSMPLVPNSQCNITHTGANRLLHQDEDAVVPQLSFEHSDNNSYDSADFEPEE